MELLVCGLVPTNKGNREKAGLGEGEGDGTGRMGSIVDSLDTHPRVTRTPPKFAPKWRHYQALYRKLSKLRRDSLSIFLSTVSQKMF